MANGNWFDDWIKEVEKSIEEMGEQLEAFFHHGIEVMPSGRWRRWKAIITLATCDFSVV